MLDNASTNTLSSYSVCVVDIGSPKLGNLGWYLFNTHTQTSYYGDNLDALIKPLLQASDQGGVLLGLEAPLFVPIREDLLTITKARLGESPRPWSAGAGAQVLAMNLPIMTYLFQKLYASAKTLSMHIDTNDFLATPSQILLFEALVSGKNKGTSHIDDARIMCDYCLSYAAKGTLPPSILQEEPATTYLNLAACALLHAKLTHHHQWIYHPSPIYRPDYIL